MQKLRDEKMIGIFRGPHYREVREGLFQVGCLSTPVATSDRGRNLKRPEKICQKEEKLGLRRGARSQRWGCCSLGKRTSCRQLRRVDSSIHSSSLSRKLISNCSSSFLRGQGIAGREGRCAWRSCQASVEESRGHLAGRGDLSDTHLCPLRASSPSNQIWEMGKGKKNP